MIDFFNTMFKPTRHERLFTQFFLLADPFNHTDGEQKVKVQRLTTGGI